MRSYLCTLALVASFLLLAVTIPSIYCTSEEKSNESLPPSPSSSEEIFEDDATLDYDSGFEEGEGADLPPKQDYPSGGGPPVPPQLPPPPPPPPPPSASGYNYPQQQPNYVVPIPLPLPIALPPPIPLPAPAYQAPYPQQLPPQIPVYENYSNYDPSYQLPYQTNFSAPIYGNEIYQQQQAPIIQQAAPATYQATAPVVNQASYQQPQVSNYSTQPAVSYQAQPAIVNYQAPQVNNYSQPAVSYQQQPQAYQAPVHHQQQPEQSYNVVQPVPIPPVVNNYQQPQVSNYSQQTISYQQPQAYQAPVHHQQQPEQSYNVVQPVPIPPVVNNYQPPQVSNYSQQTVSYQQPQAYQAPVHHQQQPEQSYNVIQPVPIPPVVNNYQPPQVSNYSQQTVSYQQPQAYQKPKQQPQQQYAISHQPIVRPQTTNYIQPPQVANYSTVVAGVQPIAPITRYSLAELAPFIPLSGYRANHWTLFYYRASPYRTCPKNVYLNPPTYKDIEAAFVIAQQQLAQTRGSSIQYLNSSQPSWAGRHQVFSFLNQQSARMDEEGLLVELVSQHLSNRACLTKWDKQRYLPTLTKFVSSGNFPQSHSCSNYHKSNAQGLQQYGSNWQQTCSQSRYRTYDGFCNNPYHPYWGKSNVCHIRLLSPDYSDGISSPRNSYNPRFPLPNPRLISNYIHNDIPIDGPYNLMKMQWGQFINHDITNTALSSYDGLVDCCKNPGIRGCWPIYVPPGDRFYGPLNVTCLSFIRSGVCPLCELGPRQQINKNTAFLDASHVYGNTNEQANALRIFRGGLLKFSEGKNNEILLPISSGQEQCSGICYQAGDNRVNQHPALTALHTLLLRNHNYHARMLSLRHPNYSDEIIFQEARRLNIAEYQMITYSEYLPIVFGPILTAYYKLLPQRAGNNLFTYYEPKADPTTWNEYSTASCRFGHSQISSTFGLYHQLMNYGQQHDPKSQQTFRLKDWFLRPSLLADGLTKQIILGLVGRQSQSVDPWVTNDVRNHLYQSHKDLSGGDLPATNIWRGRDHGIPGYVHYVEYCFNFKVRGWKDLQMFIPYYTLNQLRKLYKVVENIDLFTGGISERHFPGADIGPTFACINGIQYYHLKFGDRYWFEHTNQAGSFNPIQLEEIKRTTLARLLCRTAYLQQVPQYAFLQPSVYNPLVNCSYVGELDYNKF